MDNDYSHKREKVIDIRCPKCHTILFKAKGTGAVIEIHCKRCDILVQWPSMKPEVVTAPTAEDTPPPPAKSRRVFE